MDSTRDTATGIVARLLSDDYANPEEFEQRPGGKADPHRQVGIKMKFGKKDFTGKRPKGSLKPAEPAKLKQHPRFNLKFDEQRYLRNMESARNTAERVVQRLLGETTAQERQPDSAPRQPFRPPMREASSSSTSVGKAFKKGKKSAGSGHSVAGKPGKVSYREALIRHVNEKLKMKSAGKGKPVSKAPGSVSYKKEDFQRGYRTRDLPLQEKMARGSGTKGGKAKKLVGTIAKKPGAVSYGKK